MRLFIPFFLFASFFITMQVAAQPCISLSITSATTIDANCPASGSITVTATGTSVTYRLVSGPAGYPTAVNSTGVFSALAAGNYTVEAKDACNNTTTVSRTINNTYPAFSVINATATNVCTSSTPGGTITANVTGGQPPYQYDIVPLGSSPVYSANTASTNFVKAVTTFDTYRVYAKDACGEVRTYDYELKVTQPLPLNIWYESLYLDRPCSETMDGLPTITWNLTLLDSTNSPIDFNDLIGAIYQIYKPNPANSIDASSVNGTCASGSLLSAGTIDIANINPTNGDYYPLTIPQEDVILILTTKCGQQFKYCYNFNYGAPVIPVAYYTFIQQSCSTVVWNNQTLRIRYSGISYMKEPVSFTLVKNGGGTENNTTGNFDNLMPADFPAVVTATDACGRTHETTFNMPVQGSQLEAQVSPAWDNRCTTVKGAAAAYITVSGGDLAGYGDATDITITGGPSTTLPTITGFIEWLPGWVASNLVADYTYKVVITNLCGEKDSVLFTVPANHWGQPVLDWNLTASANALCGQNQSTITANSGYTGFNPQITYYLYNSLSPNTLIASNSNGVFNNVAPGNYKIKFVITGSSDCPDLELKDSVTISILGDGAGQTITRKTVTACEDVNGNQLSTGKAIIEVNGSGPFTYEIIKTALIGSGGEVWTVSSTNNPSNTYMWDIPLAGDPSNTQYTLRSTDKCDNKVTTQASLQPLNPPSITAGLNPCIGQLDYTLSVVPYGGNFTYRWVKLPNVATTLSTSNSITFAGAYNAAFNGTYRCFVTLAGCVERYVDQVISSTNCNLSLPIHLVYFGGGINGQTATLNWISENEVNFSHFEIERSTNGTLFEKAGTVAAKNSTTTAYYDYSDYTSSFVNNFIYYRLKIVDKNGKYTYSTVVKLSTTSNNKMQVAVYPNPANTIINVIVYSAVQTKGLLRIFSKDGKLVSKIAVTLTKGNNSINTAALQKEAAGTYFIEVSTPEKTERIKVSKF